MAKPRAWMLRRPIRSRKHTLKKYPGSMMNASSSAFFASARRWSMREAPSPAPSPMVSVISAWNRPCA